MNYKQNYATGPGADDVFIYRGIFSISGYSEGKYLLSRIKTYLNFVDQNYLTLKENIQKYR
jgi:hypothetical protein